MMKLAEECIEAGVGSALTAAHVSRGAKVEGLVATTREACTP